MGTTRICCVGQISNFLPEYGICWTTDDSGLSHALHIRDSRSSENLEAWLECVTESEQGNLPLDCADNDDKKEKNVPQDDEWSQDMSQAERDLREKLTEKKTSKILFTLVTSNRSLSKELKVVIENLNETLIERNVKIEFSQENLKSILESETAKTFGTHLINKLILKSQKMYQSVYMNPRLKDCSIVLQINKHSTTLMDSAAIALNVRASDSNPKEICLLAQLNKNITPMGKRRMPHNIITHPLTDKELIDFRFALTEWMMTEDDLLGKIQHVIFPRLMDLDKVTFQLHTARCLSSSHQKKFILTCVWPLVKTIGALIAMKNLLIERIRMREINEETKVGAELFKKFWLNPFTECLNSLSKINTLISHVFDKEKLKANGAEDDGIIMNHSLVPSLKGVIADYESLMDDMERLRQAAETDLCGAGQKSSSRARGSLTGQKIKFVHHVNPFGTVMRSPKSVEINSSKYIVIRVNKNECLFTSKNLQHLVENIADAKTRIETTQESFIAKAIEVLGTYIDPLCKLADLVGLFDVVSSFACVIKLLPNGHTWTKPEIVTNAHIQKERKRGCEEGQEEQREEEMTERDGSEVTRISPMVCFKKGRHAVLELLHELQGGASSSVVVPNDAELMGNKTRMILVTGANTGGKSTYAKQQALLIVLAQIGCLVPSAKDSVLSPISIIWLRIGAADNPMRGVSTFMTEALETAELIKIICGPSPHYVKRLFPSNVTRASDGCTDESLNETSAAVPAFLVIDELGRGTGSLDGLAFAYGVLKSLSEQKSVLGIFATHFHELGKICSQLDAVAPMCVGKTEDGMPNFRLLPGVEEDSDGILLAQRFDFPKEIIDEAFRSAANRKEEKRLACC